MSDDRSRAGFARLLAVGAPLFGVVIGWLLDADRWTDVLKVAAIAVLPFWILAFAIRSRRRDERWRFGARDVRILAALLAILIATPAIWSFFTREQVSGVNWLLGCFTVAVPIAVPLILAFGLALARESAEES